MGDFSMLRFIKWMFSHRSERERMLMNNRREIILHDLTLFVLLFAAAIVLSINLSGIHNNNNQFSVPVFILVVCLIARFTTGYIYGVVGSILGVVCVN